MSFLGIFQTLLQIHRQLIYDWEICSGFYGWDRLVWTAGLAIRVNPIVLYESKAILNDYVISFHSLFCKKQS